MMNDFVIDTERCIKCGLCVKDCPTGAIVMDTFPVLNSDACIKCSHCLAVCPKAALSILGKKPAGSTLLKGNLPSAKQMEILIKGRRSVRQYSDKNVASETIRELVDIASHAPTGVNACSVQFTVIDNKDTMDAFRNEVYERLEKMLSETTPDDDHIMKFLNFAVKQRNENGSDIILRGAPHLVVTSSPKATPCPEADTHIALAYFELMAQSMGLGTLWNGMLKMALTSFSDIPSRLGIPEEHLIGYVMIFGKPAVQYHRTVERGSANIKTASWK
ncbi:MAG: nitroreductase family protein [Sedimentisphaeraceae bacterium JB056]